MDQNNFCIKCGSKLETREIDDRVRKACSKSSCDFVLWDNPVPVIAVIVEYNENVILAKNSLWKKNIYSIITGFLERDETPEECAVREVKEELGLDSEVENFFGILSFPQTNQLLIGYHVVATGEIKLGDEISDVKQIPIKKLRGWEFGTGFVVREFLKIKGL